MATAAAVRSVARRHVSTLRCCGRRVVARPCDVDGQPRRPRVGRRARRRGKVGWEPWQHAVPPPRSVPASSPRSALSSPSRRRRSAGFRGCSSGSSWCGIGARRRHRLPDPARRDLERHPVGCHRPHARHPRVAHDDDAAVDDGDVQADRRDARSRRPRHLDVARPQLAGERDARRASTRRRRKRSTARSVAAASSSSARVRVAGSRAW